MGVGVLLGQKVSHGLNFAGENTGVDQAGLPLTEEEAAVGVIKLALLDPEMRG